MGIFSITRETSGRARLFLGIAPFVILIVLYLITSHSRLQENPNDKIFPSVAQMADKVQQLAFTKDSRTGAYLFWADTYISLKRLIIGITISAIIGFLLGIYMGMVPALRSFLLPFVTFFSILPPISILPIIFLMAGINEFAKILLIVIGTFSLITRDIYLSTRRIPIEHVIKGITLGASSAKVIYHIIIPQILPRLLDSLRIALGAAWIFLIVAEAITASEGLGYRIFLVRRYLAMDIIIPYVIWLTLIGYLMDVMLRKFIEWKFPWYVAHERN